VYTKAVRRFEPEEVALASAFGDFFMKYSTIRAGVYLPVWTRLAPQR